MHFHSSVNHVGDEGAIAIAGAMKDNKNVAYVNLSREFVSFDGGCVCVLVVVVLLFVLLCFVLFCFDLLICFKLFKKPRPFNLFITDNDIGVKGAKAIADALKENNSLTYIDLSCEFTVQSFCPVFFF